jgi:hypothetical protein
LRQNYVLVAGYDYRGIDKSRVDFMELARNHASFLRTPAQRATRFTIFDVARGIVEEQVGCGEDMSVHIVAKYEPIQASHYEVQPSGIPAFRAKSVRTLSILDIYNYVAQLGISEPGTLLELAFISHSWGGGPILVNSFDPIPGLVVRHFDDKDGRTGKDFAASNMSTHKSRLFRTAFCPKSGRIFNFGCANGAAARDVLDQLCRQWHPSHDSTRMYDFVFDSRRLSNYRATHPEFFFDELPTTRRSLAQCQAFLHRCKQSSYSQKIADVAGVGCWAAFPGTSSDYEQDVPFPVMSVRKHWIETERDIVPRLRFIKLSLGYVEDPMRRGFIEFKPHQPETAMALPWHQRSAPMAKPDDAIALHAARCQLEGLANS